MDEMTDQVFEVSREMFRNFFGFFGFGGGGRLEVLYPLRGDNLFIVTDSRRPHD